MNQPTIFHNPRCSKSRQTLGLLIEQGFEPQIREYLKQTPTLDELRELLKLLKLNVHDIIRQSEAIYKELELGQRQLSDTELTQIICTHPQLLQRPIVIHNYKAAIGRPPENVLEIL